MPVFPASCVLADWQQCHAQQRQHVRHKLSKASQTHSIVDHGPFLQARAIPCVHEGLILVIDMHGSRALYIWACSLALFRSRRGLWTKILTIPCAASSTMSIVVLIALVAALTDSDVGATRSVPSVNTRSWLVREECMVYISSGKLPQRCSEGTIHPCSIVCVLHATHGGMPARLLPSHAERPP
jgi:hypothetical protein